MRAGAKTLPTAWERTVNGYINDRRMLKKEDDFMYQYLSVLVMINCQNTRSIILNC